MNEMDTPQKKLKIDLDHKQKKFKTLRGWNDHRKTKKNKNTCPCGFNRTLATGSKVGQSCYADETECITYIQMQNRKHHHSDNPALLCLTTET